MNASLLTSSGSRLLLLRSFIPSAIKIRSNKIRFIYQSRPIAIIHQFNQTKSSASSLSVRNHHPMQASVRQNASAPSCYKHEFIAVDIDSGSAATHHDESNGLDIRVISYNVLAQAYIKNQIFPHSPRPCLRWKARSKVLGQELIDFNADFLCLQELDEFSSFYESHMKSHGYASLYKKRAGRKKDGSCIFFKENRFELLKEDLIDYNDLVPEGMIPQGHYEGTLTRRDWGLGDGPTSVPARKDDTIKEDTDPVSDRSSLGTGPATGDGRIRLLRDCVGVLGAFRERSRPKNRFIVASTHLFWDEDWVDVKMAQAEYLLKRLRLLRQSVMEHGNGGEVPIVLSGDFNAVPGDTVYTYLTSAANSFSVPLPSPDCSGEVISEPEGPEPEPESEPEPEPEPELACCGPVRVFQAPMEDTGAGVRSTMECESESDVATSCRLNLVANGGGGTINDRSVCSNSTVKDNYAGCESASVASSATTSSNMLISSFGDAGGEPAFSTVTPKFTATIDYIFLSPPPLTCVRQRLRLPQNADDPTVAGGLPNLFHPSDHLPIGIDVTLYFS